jgi:glycosyltransferase involved in cell wall biosynthesis
MAVASVVSFIDWRPQRVLRSHKPASRHQVDSIPAEKQSVFTKTKHGSAGRVDACNNAGVPAPAISPTDRRPERPSRGGGPLPKRLLAISHPAVVNVNQEVYRELTRRGWEVTIVVPSRWRHEYSAAAVSPRALEGMETSLRPTPIALGGRPQRHFYLTSCRAQCARSRPEVAFIEAEPFAIPAMQWGRAFAKLGIPFGVQCYENIDRDLPRPIRWMRTRVLHDAAFVAARSERAAQLARAWGAKGEVDIAPPAVPRWEGSEAGGSHRGPIADASREWAGADASHERSPGATPHKGSSAEAPPSTRRPFTVGYAGRLIESKGLFDLLAAVRELGAPVELLLIGKGELRSQLEGQSIPGSRVRVLDPLAHDQMASGYARFDVLVLPSHTTPTWKEQFGRVIVEALWCGVPVVGSDSGEIPWLIGLTGGGLVFPEGDHRQLADRLRTLQADPALRRQLAERGRASVERLFSVPAATDPLERLLTGAVKSKR